MSEQKTIFLGITFHFHQPIDNFDSVFEDCFQKAYGPLIDSIFDFPEVKVTLHFSGNLLEWFIENKPEIIKKLKIMARRGQIEIIGGGYYEPMFAIIPHRDRIAQMKKLSDLIKKEFGLEVKGAWLSERVWEPSYPTFLNEAGLKYIIVDDNHLRSCGIAEDDTFYTYVTEDEGKTIRIFPINEELRYLTPWKPTYLSIDYLRDKADEKGDRMALLISDAEKMGVWGTTHEICYVDGYGHHDGDGGRPFIPSLFEQITKNKWIKSITLSEYMREFPAKSLLYIPTASYDKMEEWALPTHIRKKYKKIRKNIKKDERWKEAYQFLSGGFWRYFLVKYPESNNMHKKMLYVREKLIQIEERLKELPKHKYSANIKTKIEEAWDEIYKAQCNDCYWHGMFGGVYLQFLRFAVYTHLINAEKIIDELNPVIYPIMSSFITITPIDFNKNSKMDILIESNILNAYFDPSDGATIFELDYKPKSYNLLNTLTRWYEAYHKDEKIESKEVMIDRYRRSMLRLRFFNEDVSLEQLQEDTYFDFGDFVDGVFGVSKSEKHGTHAVIEFDKEGSIKDTESDERVLCRITKNIEVEQNNILVFIEGKFWETSENREAFERIIENIHIGIDIPFFFNGDMTKSQWEGQYELEDENEKNLLEPLEYKGIFFKTYDATYDLHFEVLPSCNTEIVKISKFPIVAYAFTDEGYKSIYQGINFIPIFKLDKTFKINLKLKID